MATFLTTSRMSPALAARIEASVRGRRNKPGEARRSPRLVALARVAVVVIALFVAYSVAGARRRDRDEVERVRAALLVAVRAQSALLTPADRGAVDRVETWLVRERPAYEGDLVAASLREKGALDALLRRPMVYVRGALGSFANPARIAEAAATSSKDALVVCLLEPPASKNEKVLLASVRIAYAGGVGLEDHTANVRRLHDAIVGLPVLAPAWDRRVAASSEPAELARLRRELDRAPLERARQAARAEVLLFVMDEPSDGGGPTELDGERAHAIRLGLVDLASGERVLLRRLLVDPSWISLAKKSEYASGLDACAFAFDVRASIDAAK